MRKPTQLLIFFSLLLLTFSLSPAKEVSARPPAQTQINTPSQLIEAVNNLRISYGVPPLTVNAILMQTAQSQTDYMAATGQVTHTRPGGMSYTQQLLTLGFPLAGDLSLGGFRAENILSSNSPLTWGDVPPAWQDAEHMNTMLSQNFTQIGAGIAQGSRSYYYAVDVAAVTGSGQMQSSASSILSAAPAAEPGDAAGVSQFMVPVAISTARANGDVFHKVQYGQSLWSIAIAYGTTIKTIQALNNLGEDLVVYQGQELLVQKAATQPAPSAATLTPVPEFTAAEVPTSVIPAMSFPTELYPTPLPPTPAQEVVNVVEPASSTPVSSQFLVALLIIAAFVGAGVAVWLIRDPN